MSVIALVIAEKKVPAAASGPPLQALRVGRGLAVADFDNDGYLDVAMTSVGRPAVLLKNRDARKGNGWRFARRDVGSNAFGPDLFSRTSRTAFGAAITWRP